MSNWIIHLLYVDDEPALLEIGKAYLERSGDIFCDTAITPRIAIQKLKEKTYDAIISDFQMPDMDGIEFLKYVRLKCGDVPFIIFTGRGREEVVIQALNNGADFYLQKGGDPVSQFVELEHNVKQAFNRFKAEEKILRISRFNKISVQINSRIFKYKDRYAFFSDICRLLVEEGMYCAVWVGILDHSQGNFSAVAAHGPGGEIPLVALEHLSAMKWKDSPIARAIMAGDPVYASLEEAADFLPKTERKGEDLPARYAALVPLFVTGKVTGLLCLWSFGEDAFSQEEKDFFLTICSDISTALERMEADEVRGRAEESLAESNQQMEDIIDFLPDATFAIDRDGRVIAWNRAIEEMTGVEKGAMLGRGDYAYSEAIYGQRHPIFIDLVLGNHTDTESQYPDIHRKGDTLHTEVFRPSLKEGRGAYLWIKGAPLLNRKGERIGAIESIRDITHLKETEKSLLQKNEELGASLEELAAIEEELRQQMEEISRNEAYLRESEGKYRAIFKNTGTATVILKEDGTIVLANTKFERLSGYSREEIENKKKWMEFVVREDLDRMLAQHRLRRKDPERALTRYTFHFRKRSGEIRVINLTVDLIPGSTQSVASLDDITEQKVFEEELRSLTEEYAHLLENITDVYYRSDSDGKLVKASRSWATLLGYDDVSECIGRKIASDFYYVPEERRKLLDELYDKERVTDYEVVLKRKDGTPVTVATSSYVLRDKSGKITGVDGTFRDITQQKQMVEALREAEQRLNEIIEFLPDATFAIDTEGIVIAWNRAMEEMTGVPAAEMMGKGEYAYAIPFYGEPRPILIDLATQPDEEIKPDYTSVYKEGRVLMAETSNAKLLGREVVLWGKATPLYDTQGRLTGAIESIRDITEEKKTETLLRESESRYRRLAENAQDLIYRIELIPTRRFSYVSQSAKKITGYTPEEHYADPDLGFKLVYDEDRHIIGTLMQDSTAFNRPLVLRWKKKDGLVFWTEQINIPVYDDDGKLVAIEGIARDITQRKQNEEILRENEEKFRLANKKLTLLYSITRHDINNQLVIAGGILDLMQMAETDPGREEYFQKLATACERIRAMVRFTGEYENIGVHAPVWHDCYTLMETAAADISLGQVQVINEIPAGVEVFSDPLVAKVCYTLLENAVRHGRKVTTVRLSLEEDVDTHTIVCEDDGIGIPAGEKEKIFERGYGKNTGFGLFLSREILEITDITIQETGVPGEGARFEITIPAKSMRKKWA